MPSPNDMTLEQFILFFEIQDIIGNFSYWPTHIQNWFLYGVPAGRGQRLRPILAGFVWINGLNPEVFLDWCKLFPDLFSADALAHFAYLFQSFDSGYLQYIYSYNITLGHYQTINGTFHDPSKWRSAK